MSRTDDEDLITTLGLLANDCEADDRRMTAGPWTYNDDDTEMRAGQELVLAGGSVGYENARMIVEENDGLAIATVRNRLPDLVKVLREAARQIEVLRADRDGYQDGLIIANNAAERRGAKRDELAIDHAHLQRLYKESREYVATLVRERDELVAGDKQRVEEINNLDGRVDDLVEEVDALDTRVEQLEKALAEALDIAEYEIQVPGGKREHVMRVPELRSVLKKVPPS
jgi:chromosome segregation ATPase